VKGGVDENCKRKRTGLLMLRWGAKNQTKTNEGKKGADDSGRKKGKKKRQQRRLRPQRTAIRKTTKGGIKVRTVSYEVLKELTEG